MEGVAQKIPITAQLLRNHDRSQKDTLALLVPFNELLSEKISGVLSQMGEAPCKASIERAAIVQLAPLQQSESGFEVTSAQDTMPLWFETDRSFDAMLCELCLGGTGVARAGEEQERPPSSFERGLRNLVLGKMAEAIAASLAEVGERGDVTSSRRGRVAVRKIENSLPCHSLRILLNVFETACELTVHLALSECLKLAGCAKPAAGASAAGQVLDTTAFSLEVFLKPEVVDVRHILGLTAGGVLKLNVAAASPVELRFNGQKIGLGLMGHDGERVRVRLMDDRRADGGPPTVQNLLKLVNERVAEL